MLRLVSLTALRPALLAALLLTAHLAARAQGLPGNGGTTGGPPAPQATTVPLDGGASLLLAAGVATGLRHLRQRQRQRRAH